MSVGWRRLVLNLLTERLRVFMRRRGSVQRVGHAILLGLAEMIHQQVSSDRGHPGDERSLRAVVAGERAVHLDEDLLGEILGVVGGAGKAVADVIDTPVVSANDFFPGSGVAGNATADQHRDYLDVFQTMLPGKSGSPLSAVRFQRNPTFEPT